MHLMLESMIQIAKEAAIQSAESNGDIVAAYLTGLLLDDDPFLGGSADIDLVFFHAKETSVRREIVSRTPEIPLDIKHNPRREYNPPRELRIHPWLGPEMYDPLLLYETGHFFKFVQAGLRNKYHEPVNIILRARRNAEHDRQMCNGLQFPAETGPALVLKYLKAVKPAANAISLLNGAPLAERRFLLHFPARAEASGRPALSAGLLALLSTENMEFSPWPVSFLSGKQPSWKCPSSHPPNSFPGTPPVINWGCLAMISRNAFRNWTIIWTASKNYWMSCPLRTGFNSGREYPYLGVSWRPERDQRCG